METSNINYFFVRAMDQEEKHFNVFFEKNVVAVGWSDINFSKFDDSEALVSVISQLLYLAKI